MFKKSRDVSGQLHKTSVILFSIFFRLPPQRNVVICLDRYNRQPMKAQCTYFEQKEKNYAEMLKSFYRLTDEIAYLITIVIKLVN